MSTHPTRSANVTCALAVITPSEKMLVVHPTGAGDTGNWSLPKGIADDGEDHRTSAARECFEETGLDLRDHLRKFIDCGRHVYVKNKDLQLFVYHSQIEIDVDVLHCTSTFTTKSGSMLAECDAFDVVPFERAFMLLTAKQRVILQSALHCLQHV